MGRLEGTCPPMRRALAVTLLALTACVGPARSFGSYEGKAGATADDMRAAVGTASLAAELAGRDRAFAPYLSVVLADAEEDASAVQGAFDSIQPPDTRSDRLRGRLDAMLSQAVSTLGQLRIAARRGKLGLLPDLARALPALSARLDAFAEAHG
jgi:alkanesulfonate monooxygenase SsuD/methylene tetrahydromethanopterin reductase-like flavin-dependent oxidoreductase (luciferase family)